MRQLHEHLVVFTQLEHTTRQGVELLGFGHQVGSRLVVELAHAPGEHAQRWLALSAIGVDAAQNGTGGTAAKNVGREVGGGSPHATHIRPHRGLGPLALIRLQLRRALNLQRAKHVEPVTRQVAHAPRHAERLAVAAAIAVATQAGRNISAFVVTAGDEVDHAAHGIGPVDGRGAVFQHFNALQGCHGNGAQVHALTAEGVVGHAPAIQQHQR